MDFKDLIQKRRSHRKFTDEPIDGDAVKMILRAGLMSPTGHSKRAWHFIVVEDKTDLEKLADAREAGSQFLKSAALAVVVTCSPEETDCWIEDCSLAAVSMQYQAEELGLGSCWTQTARRGLSDGTMATDIVRGILDIPESQNVLCILGFGHPADERKPQSEDNLKWENVHIGKWE